MGMTASPDSPPRVADGLPEADVELLVYLFREVPDGRNIRPADGVQRTLGRRARDFTDFARAAAARGVWAAPAASFATAPAASAR